MTGSLDPRACALAQYLRDHAARFSLSADVNESTHIADAGMALLDAAVLAAHLRPNHPLLVTLSEAGLFETMPQDRARVVETPEVRRAVQRPLAGNAQDGSTILRGIASAVRRP